MKDIDDETAVSKYTGLGLSVIRNGRCGNSNVDIPYLKLGRSVRYRKSDVDAWLDERLVITTPKTTKAA